ncbi:MAG TPA: DEAD/DEAH box helicase family protein [Solirubrobacterales bacterium]|nr:DEAD/DEAH box helicase family protein [Solirubrobacterales bacterium]
MDRSPRRAAGLCGPPASDRARPYRGAPLYDDSQHLTGGAGRVRSLPDWPAGRPLRSWQQEATEAVRAHPGTSFLASATPAAGKTTFGLHIAHRMLRAGFVSRVVVGGPTTHICRQWAADAGRYGIDLEPNRPNSDGPESADFHGVSVTYQTIASGPETHRLAAARRSTLLIADEPHHMGDLAAWGVQTRKAFDGARFRLLLSGTPFRSDSSAIPWVAYDEDGLSLADYAYGYPQALRDRVCRPITFLPYDGEMEWVSDGRLRSADFDLALPAAEAARRLRTALSPEGEWMGEVLRDGNARLSEVRAEGHPGAGGLVIASDQDHARAIAARLATISGQQPELVMSDEPGASRRIAGFAASDRRWLVSVLMVSEGVDIPRLRVGVYATAARTELFFRQVVGRFIRATPEPRNQMSYLLMPADQRLKALAHEIELERRHALDLSPAGEEEEAEEIDDARPEQGEPGGGFAALSSGDAELDEAIMSETALQLFPTDDPEPKAKKASSAAAPRDRGDSESAPESAYEARERLRNERRRLVGDVARRTGGSHREIQARINRATRARSVASATIEQLERGNEMLRGELWR